MWTRMWNHSGTIRVPGTNRQYQSTMYPDLQELALFCLP